LARHSPPLSIKHDTPYLQSTKLVPTYMATVAPSAAVVAALPTTYTPLQLGSYTTPMAATGYHLDIGLLPEWDVLYLTTSADARMVVSSETPSAQVGGRCTIATRPRIGR
jgi:hypothetical protein